MLWHRAVLTCLRELPMVSSTVFVLVKFFLFSASMLFVGKCLTVGSWYAGAIESVR